MRTLANVLEGAVSRAASEVLLESGQPVVYTTSRGSEAESTVLPGSDLFDMIAAAVDDGQQIELAVGNPVEFEIDAGAKWSVLAEPGMEGIRVRAEREAPEGGAAFSLDVPGFDEAESPPKRGGSAAAPGIDFQPFDASLADRPPEAAAPFESGTWALEDDDDFEVGHTGEHQAVSGGLGIGMASESDLGVPDDDDDAPFAPLDNNVPSVGEDLDLGLPNATGDFGLGAADPFMPPPPQAPPVPTVGGQGGTDDPASSAPVFSAPPRKGGNTPPVKATAPTQRAMDTQAIPDRVTPMAGSRGSAGPTAVTHRELPAMSRDTETRRELPVRDTSAAEGLTGLAANITEGALVYISESGFGELLAEAFHVPNLVVDDRVSLRDAWARLRTMPVGSIVVLTQEDPSETLDWLLRRLEEGYRVFLETRARTPDGARRILLGVGATDRAERWLESQNELVIEPSQSGPKLRRA